MPKLLVWKSEGPQVSVSLGTAEQTPCDFLAFAAGAGQHVLGGDVAGTGALLP